MTHWLLWVREKKLCVPYIICKWRKTNYDIPNSCINLGMSKSNCLHKHYSRPLCHLENTGNHLCYAWSYSYYKVTKHFLQSIWNLGDFCHFYCLEWPVSQTFKQASAYEAYDHTRTRLNMPKILEICKEKHALFDEESFKVCSKSHN